MPYTQYHLISKERNETINKRYAEFIRVADIPNAKPVKVFDPLAPKLIEELNLIRELSVQLQKKKNEDLKKAAQAEAEAEAEAETEAQKAAEEAAKTAEVVEEENTETKES